ncbi:hypothetical protein ACFLT7_08450 [candidate division KSB1 bacterium]
MVEDVNLRAIQPEGIQPSPNAKPGAKAKATGEKSFKEVLGEVNKLETKVDSHLQGVSKADDDVRRAALEVDRAFELTMKMSSKLSEAYKAYQQDKTD